MTTSSPAAVVGGRRAVTVVAAFFVSGIALGSFALSFAALSELASMSGIPRSISWVWPLIVDGSIVTAMLVIFAWRGASRRETAWPWTTLIFFAAVSVVGNGVHTVAVIDGTTGVSVPFAVFVGAIPPVSLLLSSEMLVRIMVGPRRRKSGAASDAVIESALTHDSDPEPEPPLLPLPEPLAVNDPVPVPVPVAEAAMTQPALVPEPVTANVTEAGSDEVAEVSTPLPVAANEPEPEPAPADEEGETPLEVPLPGLSDEPVRDATTESATELAVELDAESVTEPVEEAAAAEPTGPAPAPVLESKDAPTGSWAPTLIEGAGVPEGKAAQLQFIVARARAGQDISKATLADLLEVSDRTAFRRLADAKALAPDAFAEQANHKPLIGASK